MVRHIVSWNFKPEVSPEKRREVGELLTRRMKALEGLIPCVQKVDFFAPPVGLSNCDLAMYSEVDCEENLPVYRDHPEHQAVVKIIHEYCCERRCTDLPAL